MAPPGVDIARPGVELAQPGAELAAPGQLAAYLAGVEAGEFDDLARPPPGSR
ncbi:MAG: hypothetical protein ACRDQB_03115 [Thermocrispum sp.]